MTIEEFARIISLARIVYQVEIPGERGQLVDPDCLRVDVCPPGVSGLADPEGKTPATWRVTIGEENDGDLARGEGATLTEAVQALQREVKRRSADVADAMREAEVLS